MVASLGLVRAVPDSFPRALVRSGRPTLDASVARRQHVAYRSALRDAGVDLQVVDFDENHPDCPFIEDVAVVIDGLAVITRPGAPSRRGERDGVAAALSPLFALRRIEAPGTIDGGDVLRVGQTFYVGRSERTNEEGFAQFARYAAEVGVSVASVGVRDVLHLKSAAAVLDHETLLLGRGLVDEEVFAGLRLVDTVFEERAVCSALRLPDDTILMTESAPATAQRVADAGFGTAAIDVSEFQAADGGLTCLSVLF